MLTTKLFVSYRVKTGQVLPLIVMISLIGILVIPAETATAQLTDGITLKASSTTQTAGKTIDFFGTFYEGGRPQHGATVRLLDSSNANKEIGNGVVSKDSYFISWETNSNDVGKHKIYAWSTEGDVPEAYSKTIEVTVNAPKLTLNAFPLSVTEGEPVRFSGIVKYEPDNTSIPNATIKIFDSSNSREIGKGTTDTKGQYFVDWNTASDDIGSHKIYAQYSDPIISDFITYIDYFSPTIGVDVLAISPPIHSLTLDVDQTTITEGEKITFSGSYASDENPLSSHEIMIMDETTGEPILTTTTNPNGSYLQEWVTAQENIGSHTFYAQSLYDPNNLESQLDVSTKHIVTVSPEIPILVLDPLPAEVEEGDVINITGYITTDDFYGNRVRININNDQSRFLDKINLENIFSIPWRATSDDIGANTIYAECICDEQNLQTPKQTVTVYGITPPDPPLKVTIIPSVTSGEAPLTVTFRSSVSGDSQSYQYDWDVSGTKYYSSVVSHTFHNANESYFVKLTVTDSNQQAATAEIYINVRDPLRPDPKILVSGTLEEGSEITFTAGGSYPEKVNSYEWDFGDDGDNGYSREVTHSYDDDKQYTIKFTVSDNNGEISTYKTLNIKNKAPEITSLYSEKSEIETNESSRFEGKFIDQGKYDTFDVIWYVDNQKYSNKINSIQSVIQNHKFDKSGDYEVTLIIRDDDGGQDQEIIPIHVKDPFPWIYVVAGAAAVAG